MTAMNQARLLQTYRENEIQTVDPGTVLLRLYAGAIDFTEEALARLKSGDVPGKGLYIGKAHKIVSEFLASLDFEAGGELARNLEGLYVYMLEQLTAANINNDPEPLEAVASLLVTLRQGWEGAIVAERKRVARESA